MTRTSSHPTLVHLTEQLVKIASATGCEPKEVTLTSVATASLLLGLGDGYRPMLTAIADHEDVPALVAQQWQWWQKSFPYLEGHLDPITGWLNAPREGQSRVLARQLQHLASVDLPTIAESPQVAGDILGQVLTLLSSPGDRSAKGAFYTPASLATVMAQMGGLEGTRPNEAILEPCCGGGGLLVAAVRHLRSVGKAPELRRWILQDIDPYAVAIAGIAMSIHGIPAVTLRCGNSLASDPVAVAV